jgi:hypothetical protein
VAGSDSESIAQRLLSGIGDAWGWLVARVTTLIYRATGRKTGTSGTVEPTPTNSTVRPPLLSNSETLYAPAVEADGLILAPFTDNSQAFYGPIVSAAAVFVSPPLLANTQVIFPPTVNQQILLPLLSNEQTFGEPLVLQGQSVVSPLLSNSQAFYGPQVNQSVIAPLLSNSETLYGPTIVTGTSILPTPLVNTQAFYGPQLNMKVTPGLLTNTQTFPGPSVASGYIVRPTTFASGQAFYAPQVNLKVVSGFISNAQTFYGPVVSADTLIVAPLLTNSQTFYAPKLNLKVLVPLLTNSSAILAPAVIPDTAQAVNAPYHLNSQTFYGPQLNRNIKPTRLTNTSGFFTLTVSNGPNPGFALSTPSVTVISAAGDPPEITLGINSDHYAGYYLDIERSTVSTKNTSDGSYASPTLKIAHQIEPEELAALAITNADLAGGGYTNPAGAYFQQYRIRREDGALSAWVEISGTVTASVAQLHTVSGFNRASSLTYPSVGHEFEIQNINVGSLRKARATISTTGKKQFEVTINIWTTGSRIAVGIDDGNIDFSTGGIIPGNTGTPNGVCFRAQQGSGGTIYANGAVNQSAPANSTLQVGDIISTVIDTTAATVKFYRTRSGATVQIGTTVPIGFGSTVYAFGGTERVDNIEFNFGASSFARPLDTGFAIYG